MTIYKLQSIINKIKIYELIGLYEIKAPKKHGLVALYKLVKEKNKNMNIDEDILDRLTELYIDSRYPGELGLLPNGKPSIDDSKEFYEFAKRSYEMIKSHVEGFNKKR